MPYITTERVAEIRAELKKEFPEYKFSITREDHSGIQIAIMEAPVDFTPICRHGEGYIQVNHFHIENNYREQPEIKDPLLKIYNIANAGNRTLVEDGDYGSVPCFYVWLHIGKWDKPFKFVPKEVKEEVAPVEVPAGTVQVIEYSDKAIAVIGETYPIREKLGALGGKFNKFLKCGAGWIFPKTKLEELQAVLMPKAEETDSRRHPEFPHDHPLNVCDPEGGQYREALEEYLPKQEEPKRSLVHVQQPSRNQTQLFLI